MARHCWTWHNCVFTHHAQVSREGHLQLNFNKTYLHSVEVPIWATLEFIQQLILLLNAPTGRDLVSFWLLSVLTETQEVIVLVPQRPHFPVLALTLIPNDKLERWKENLAPVKRYDVKAASPSFKAVRYYGDRTCVRYQPLLNKCRFTVREESA